jgi:hypothetical protein
MSIFCRLSRKHYWCTPHRSEDDRLIQVCYECGAERPARELNLASRGAGSLKAYPRPVDESLAEPISHSRVREKVAVGERRARKFVIVK